MALGKKTGGRRKGTPNKGVIKPYKRPAPEGMSPLDYLLSVMRSTAEATDLRVGAAKAAAPYMHRALKAIEVSGPEGGPIEQKVILSFD